ncbi:MAG: hypothetical protein H5U03_08730 [Clostridia bacterium]|nr:hypothetical protein [Clostridia bacterium]
MELECKRFEFCPEVTAKTARMGLRIVEVPIRYQGRNIREGKKIRFRDGLVAVATLWKYRHWQPKGLRDSPARAAKYMQTSLHRGSQREVAFSK